MNTIYSAECHKTRVYTGPDTTGSAFSWEALILRNRMKDAVKHVVGAKRADELFPASQTISFRRYEPLPLPWPLA